MRLLIARALAARTLLVAAAVAAAVTMVLLTAFALYAQVLPVAGARAAITAAPAAERSLLVTTPAPPDPATAWSAYQRGSDPAVRELLARLGDLPLAVAAGGHASSQRLPDDLPVPAGRHGAYAVVALLPDLADHAALVAGDWPRPVPAGEPVQVALPDQVADELGLAIGDVVAIEDERVDGGPAPVVLVGRWRPADPAAGYWLLADPVAGEDRWGPFVVHPDEFAARYLTGATFAWVAVPAPGALAGAGPGAVRTGLAGIADDLARRQAATEATPPPERRPDDPATALDESTRLATGLGELADRIEVATVVNRSSLVLPVALLAVIGGYGLVLVARLLGAHRRGENALLRARGASRRQLVWLSTAEAVLVVAPAAVLAAPAGAWLVTVADRHAGQRSLGLAADLAAHHPYGPPLAWGVSMLAAAGCATALVLPAARTPGWAAAQRQRARAGRLATARRAAVDLMLVALAVLAWVQLRQYGTAVLPGDGTGLGVDPLLVAAPVIGVVAATAVALRLLPVATRLGVRWAGRARSFAGLLGAWQADRRPHTGPVLLLVLAVATAVLAPQVAATWQQSQRDQADQAVGADLRVVAGPQDVVAPAALGAAPGAGQIMPVHRAPVSLPGGVRTDLLALTSDQAAQVARLRPDLASSSTGELFGRLRQGRPELPGLPLPEGTDTLTGTLRFEAPATVTRTIRVELLEGGSVLVDERLPSPRSGRPVAFFADAAGVVTSVWSNAVGAGSGQELELPVPAGAAFLVGLGAAVDTRPWPEPHVAEPAEPVEVRWRWEGLRAVAASGTAHPVSVPAGWRVHSGGGPEVARASAGSSVVTAVTTLDPVADAAQFEPFLLAAAPPSRTVIPAVVTSDVAAASGGGPGRTIQVGDLTLRVAEVVTALPGAAGGSGIAVDLPWMSAQRMWEQRPGPVVNEWWMSTADPARTAAALAGAGLTVHSRVEVTDRLLGDPLGAGVLLALWAAAVAAAVLAAFGLAVDARATAVHRQRELAVLHTLGTSPATLARALAVEQAVLAGLGVAAGIVVGIGVAVAMGPSLVLTESGAVPVPAPLLAVEPVLVAAPALALLGAAAGLGALVARRARRDVTAGALRIGED